MMERQNPEIVPGEALPYATLGDYVRRQFEAGTQDERRRQAEAAAALETILAASKSGRTIKG